MSITRKLADVERRYEELSELMTQPEVVSDVTLVQKYARE